MTDRRQPMAATSETERAGAKAVAVAVSGELAGRRYAGDETETGSHDRGNRGAGPQEDLRREREVRALDGVSFAVEEGTVFGLLGPNGAGKTTAVRVLTTIIRPDSGSGPSARPRRRPKRPALVRSLIGLAGQYAAVDENLTGRENIDMVGRLNHLPKKSVTNAGRRAARAVRADRRRRPAAQDLLGGHAPPPRPGRRPGGPTHRAVPRRADHRPRPAEPQRPVGGDRGAGRRGHHRAPHHPVPGGGRPAGQPARRGRPRPGDRRGHAGRAEGRPGRHRPRGRPARPRRTPPGPLPSWPPSGPRRPTSTARSSKSPWTTGPTAAMDALRSSTRQGMSPPPSPCASPASTTSSWP